MTAAAPAATDGETLKAGDERPTRLRALFDRIRTLPDDVLTRVERAVAEASQPCNPHLWCGTACADGSCDMTCSRCGERVFSIPRVTVVAPQPRLGSRFDLGRMGEAIRALPGASVTGRAIGASR